MWDDKKSAITSQLAPGETLLWHGQPKQGFLFRPRDLMYLFVIAFSAFWVFMVSRVAGDFRFFALIGLIHTFFGVYGLTVRYFIEAKQRAKTFYGVTNERVIIVSGLRTRKVESFPLKFITDLSLEERSDGTGTITFGPAEPSSSWFSRFSNKEVLESPEFLLVPDAKRIHDLIRNTQRALLTR